MAPVPLLVDDTASMAHCDAVGGRSHPHHHCCVIGPSDNGDGDVARPLLVRPARLEVLLQEIRRDVEDVVAVGGGFELPCPHNLDAVLAHQPPHTTLANLQTQLIQLLRHARSTVAAQAQAMLVADMGQEHHVTSLAL